MAVFTDEQNHQHNVLMARAFGKIHGLSITSYVDLEFISVHEIEDFDDIKEFCEIKRLNDAMETIDEIRKISKIYNEPRMLCKCGKVFSRLVGCYDLNCKIAEEDSSDDC